MEEIGREETVHPVSGAAQDVAQRLTDSIAEQFCESGFRSLAKLKGFPSSISASGVSFSLLVRTSDGLAFFVARLTLAMVNNGLVLECRSLGATSRQKATCQPQVLDIFTLQRP